MTDTAQKSSEKVKFYECKSINISKFYLLVNESCGEMVADVSIHDRLELFKFRIL